MTQPAVTFQVKQIEEQYNVKLFDRGHGKVAMTPAGEIVFQYAEKILDLSGEMQDRLAQMTGEMRGNLLVGSGMTIAESRLPRVLGEFNAQYPQVRVTLIVGNSEQIQSRVAEHTVDVGFVSCESLHGGLFEEFCCEDELCAICAPDHPLSRFDAIEPGALADYEYLSREPGSGTRECIETYLDRAGLATDSLKTQMELGSPAALNVVAATGIGFAISSVATVATEVRVGRLSAIPLRPRLMQTIRLVYPKGRFRSRVVSAFSDFAKRRLQAGEG